MSIKLNIAVGIAQQTIKRKSEKLMLLWHHDGNGDVSGGARGWAIVLTEMLGERRILLGKAKKKN